MFEGITGKEDEKAFMRVKATKQEHQDKIYEQCYFF